MQVLDRFLAKVRKSPECWIWTGYSKNGRYGSITIDGRARQAHVAAYELFVGPVPSGMVVMHSCDNPRCVNPDHLKVGTMSDNMIDCVQKGRFRKPARYKLTQPGIIGRIKEMLANGMSQRAVANKVGVSQAMICVINKE